MTSSTFLRPGLRAASQPAMGRLGLAVLLSGGFITIFDLFVVNVAIPSMQSTLSASFAQISFIIAAYELAYGVLLIAGSRLGDRHGRRRLFMLGMAAFALASALCGLAPTADALIAARILQGMAAAMLFPQVYALIRVSYQGHERRRAFGLLGMTLGLAAIAGQVLGGWIVHADLFGLAWRSIFLINVPLGLLAWRLARHIPESREPASAAMDWPGAALVGAGLALLLLALIEGPPRHWPAWTVACGVAAVATLALFVHLQRGIAARGGAPLVDMALLAQPRFAAGCLLVMLVFSTASAMFLCYAL
ncbi:MFS transporter, partial [Achromobacter insolitus]|uniref:MFS transporter n=1 Tax=Achromobacter insolitus TaxID=217204 RepID=UPI0028A85A18